MEQTKKTNGVSPKGPVVNKNSKKVFVTVDMSADEVLKLDKEGCILVFSGDPKDCLLLSEAQYGELGQQNRQRYGYALEEWEYRKEQKDEIEDLTSRFEVDPTRIAAESRLEVQNQDKNFHYVWKAPENVREIEALGGQVVSASGTEKTFGQKGEKRAHVISNKGVDELVLCRIPKVVQQKLDERGRQGLKNLLDTGRKEFGELVKQAKAEVVESMED
jgi:hypothetical protein